jgi:Zn-dependent M28 family amino/carboxypeptidase
MTSAVALFLANAALLSAAESEDLDRVLAEVRGMAYRAHVEFLADDLLEGRDTGTRGYDLAARYVATEMKAMGVEAGGEDGSWFQPVPLRESRLVKGSVSLAGAGAMRRTDIVALEDYLQFGDATRTESRVEAPVVFVGYGVSAPELGHDDYAAVDVTGKIVAMLANAPAHFPSEPRAHFASPQLKAENAARHGAVGTIGVLTDQDMARYPWARMVAAGDRTVRWLHPDGRPEGSVPALKGSFVLSPAGGRKLFASSPVSADKALADATKEGFKGFALGVTATVFAKSEHRPLTSANVVGLLPGSDPALKDTYVVYTAHLDHVGVGKEVAGDRIYNGAYDNASGSAVILEVARSLARLKVRPRRSVLFVFVTGEEKGLLGSDYFAQRPSVPAAGIVANVNVDMPLFLYPSADLVAFGAENSSLQAAAERAAARVGFTLAPDPLPDQNLFIRSDQYSFVRRGVPAVFLVPGFRSAEAGQDGGKIVGEFLQKNYHMPTDDLKVPMDLGVAERFIRANVLLGHTIASDPVAPRWNPGNFFGTTFGRAAGGS